MAIEHIPFIDDVPLKLHLVLDFFHCHVWLPEGIKQNSCDRLGVLEICSTSPTATLAALVPCWGLFECHRPNAHLQVRTAASCHFEAGRRDLN